MGFIRETQPQRIVKKMIKGWIFNEYIRAATNKMCIANMLNISSTNGLNEWIFLSFPETFLFSTTVGRNHDSPEREPFALIHSTGYRTPHWSWSKAIQSQTETRPSEKASESKTRSLESGLKTKTHLQYYNTTQNL